MRFCQIDTITLLEPGVRIEATRQVKDGEDYLRDHFPRFKVMPGVLMLEALYQTSALLVRATEEYRSGLVFLHAAKNIKFADFVQPGQELLISSEIMKHEGNRYTLKAIGHKEDSLTVAGRLVIECVPEEGPETVANYASRYMRQLTKQLQQAAVASE